MGWQTHRNGKCLDGCRYCLDDADKKKLLEDKSYPFYIEAGYLNRKNRLLRPQEEKPKEDDTIIE